MHLASLDIMSSCSTSWMMMMIYYYYRIVMRDLLAVPVYAIPGN
jgi:hypothetical protein